MNHRLHCTGEAGKSPKGAKVKSLGAEHLGKGNAMSIVRYE